MEDSIVKQPYARVARALGNERYDAIVIGSGIGGLASAALLAKHGCESASNVGPRDSTLK